MRPAADAPPPMKVWRAHLAYLNSDRLTAMNFHSKHWKIAEAVCRFYFMVCSPLCTESSITKKYQQNVTVVNSYQWIFIIRKQQLKIKKKMMNYRPKVTVFQSLDEATAQWIALIGIIMKIASFCVKTDCLWLYRFCDTVHRIRHYLLFYFVL